MHDDDDTPARGSVWPLAIIPIIAVAMSLLAVGVLAWVFPPDREQIAQPQPPTEIDAPNAIASGITPEPATVTR